MAPTVVGKSGKSIARALRPRGRILHTADARLRHDIRPIRAAIVHIGELKSRTLCAAGDVNGQPSAEVAFHARSFVALARRAPRVYAQHGEVARPTFPAMRSRNQVLGC